MENNDDIIDNKFIILRTIGDGSSSEFYRVRRLNENNKYVAKVWKNHPNNFPQELQMTTLASGLNNPNIIHLEGHGTGTVNMKENVTNMRNYMILEYCPKGDLSKYVENERFTERQAKYIFKKILLGVQALHGANICHRNLKLETVLLDNNFNPKISNFVFATQFQQNNQTIMLNEVVGTLHYASPNILSHRSYNGEKADIFSLGVLLFYLVSGRWGFENPTKKDPCYRYIMAGNIDQYWIELYARIGNMNFSNDFKDLYISMVAPNENNRPHIAQVLNHPWFNEINNLDNQQLHQLEVDVRNAFTQRENNMNNQPMNNAIQDFEDFEDDEDDEDDI